MFGKLTALATASALVATPALAAPRPSAAPVGPTTTAQSNADDAPAVARRGVPGGGIIAAVILAGVISAAVLLATQDDEADSN